MKKHRGLCQEALKGIACVTMLIDHYGIIVSYSPWLRLIGRMAFPIYCFLISEGVRHTRDPKKYLGRLLLMALVTEPIYDWVLYPQNGIWEYQNVLFTLFLGAAMLESVRLLEGRPWRYLAVVPFAILGQLIHCSYGGPGILMVALFGLLGNVPGQRWVLVPGMLLLDGIMQSFRISLLGMKIPVQQFAILALVPIFLYSGEKKTKSKVLSWAFYFYYPVHLLALYGLGMLMGR